MLVDIDWIRSPSGRQVLQHWADPRPAWLWSGDGERLLWRNGASRYFLARLKKGGRRLLPDAVPIRGQVARLIRLGALGRSGLSRIQFLVGGRPASATCLATPLLLADGQKALLVVGVDPVEAEVLAETPEIAEDRLRTALLPEETAYLVLDGAGAILEGSPALQSLADDIDLEALPAEAGEAGLLELGGVSMQVTRFEAGPAGEMLLLFEPAAAMADTAAIEAVRHEEGLADLMARPDETPAAEPRHDVTVPPGEAPRQQDSLTGLFDRLANHDALYESLPPAEPEAPADAPPEEAPSRPEVPEAASAPAPQADEPEPGSDPEPEAPAAATLETAASQTAAAPAAVTYRIVGRGFSPLPEAPPEGDADEEGAPAPAALAPHDPEVVERVSRYNFDELSRILSDRVAGEPADEAPPEPAQPAERPPAAPEGALINIAGEAFILNRLPLGILLFRDQQVLFANRALTDLVGHDSLESLRSAGLSAIFPTDPEAVGPVTHLVARDGRLLPVTARLQSVPWQGRPALMLSANPLEAGNGHEGAVRDFAEVLAGQRGDGFLAADRSGVLTGISPRAAAMLDAAADDLRGRPLAQLVDAGDAARLREFLERPARFAETARPHLSMRTRQPGLALLVFAEGQAGIVRGYYGLLFPAPVAAGDEEDAIDPSMLARVSRGVRRPLNTIIGFADLIRSAAFGVIENQRYLEYARDIRTAGQEIAVLVDELDDYARLKEGRFVTRPAELDLAALLDSCLVRVRRQASDARVLVRRSISETLPPIRADRASLGQAILNLLASAIDQTPAGGTVVVTAQHAESGNVQVNVRDGSEARADLDERFVVFRDGVGRDGERLAPVRSSVGLALTRSLLAVNACSLTVDPTVGVGTLFSLDIPADLVAERTTIA